MSNVFVDGFGTYGVGNDFTATDPIGLAMLGRYASLYFNYNIGLLPWAAGDSDLYLSQAQPILGYQNTGARVVLPSASDTVVASFYAALESLPTVTKAALILFSDGNNNPLIGIGVTSTGAIFAYQYNFTSTHPPDGTDTIALSEGPVLVAQSAAHIEVKLICGTSNSNSVEVQVNGTTVISASGLNMSWDPNFTYPHPNANSCAQVSMFPDITLFGGGAQGPRVYIGNLILRDGAGSVNNDIVGDRRVATLLVNADDPAHQGWTGEPYYRFGAGILDLTYNAPGVGGGDTSVKAAPDSSLDIGAQQFTIEGSFRFQTLPVSTNKAVLYSHWDEGHNTRECELYLGGPSLEGGNIVFRISTDGGGGTVTEIISFPFVPVTDHWYHIAITRDGSHNTRLFIDGIMQGLPQADAHTYFQGGSSGAYALLGSETNNGGGVDGTGFPGWMDEFRLTIGACRYVANFTPPSAAFPRGGSDADWADVAWISGWDSGTFLDESSHARSLAGNDQAAAFLPADGAYNFETINKVAQPLDNTFIEASLLAAAQVFTLTATPSNGETVTLGTKAGPATAVYTFKTALASAFDVLIGASATTALANLASAINAGAGSGATYGAGTTINLDAGALVLGANQITATALSAGAAGNSIACSTTCAAGSWGDTHLDGGQDIPGYSQFNYSRLPSNVTTVDSITILSRTWKTDAGVCTVKTSFVGGNGGVAAGSDVSVTTAPTFYTQLIEADPDTSGNITPTTVTNGKIRISRDT